MRRPKFEGRGRQRLYIEGVDDIKPRDVIDYTCNSNGDLLINFLVVCGLWMIKRSYWSE